MKNKNTRRGFTQINWVGQALPDNAPAKGHLAAFTLIELLVVVLIIGILAAVAVPQYRFAVEKSRFEPMLLLLQSYTNAARLYYLANGSPAPDITYLNIDLPGGATLNNTKTVAAWGKQSVTYCLSCGEQGSFQAKPDTSVDAYLEYFVNNQANANRCWAKTNLTLQNKICQHITNRTTPNSHNSYGRNGYNL